MLIDSCIQLVLSEQLPAYQCSATDAAQHLHRISQQPTENTHTHRHTDTHTWVPYQCNLNRSLQNTERISHSIMKYNNNTFTLYSSQFMTQQSNTTNENKD